MADTTPLSQDAETRFVIPDFRESIRLIVWDLDDTFWRGTLTEGGIEYLPAHHDLVVWLAENGVMSSICSKNEHASVERVLRDRGLWEYFIFPSIDWTPKAHRLSALIETIGLRPATVLFIDDNWQNLNQAAALIPTLNTAEPSIIAHLKDHAQLARKSDPGLSRLMQYKANEKKVLSGRNFAGDHFEFLRQSDVRVYFEYDVEKHLDRIIELINRTNQLNFTKKRLPEDADEAKTVLLSFLRHNGTTPGLVKVVDRFGDYGFVGFFAMTDLARVNYLQHFCFSCRTLNMYIEHFVYDFLGRPELEVVGEVLSDVKNHSSTIDWIRALPIENLEAPQAMNPMRFDKIYARGGCDLMALMHYFTMHSDNIIQEFNTLKNFQPLRLDHSTFLTASLRGLTEPERAAALALGYGEEDFYTEFPVDNDADLVLLSFWADADIPFYRHRATGLELPYWMIGTAKNNYLTDDQAVELYSNPVIKARIMDHLRPEWDYVACLTHTEKILRYSAFIEKLSPQTPIIMTLANEKDHAYFFSPNPLSVDVSKRAYNVAILEMAERFPNIKLIDFGKYVNGPDDILDMNHLTRFCYVKIYREILDLVSGKGPAQVQARAEIRKRLARDDIDLWHLGVPDEAAIDHSIE